MALYHHPASVESDLIAIYNRVERVIEDRYGIDVRIGDVIAPNTGDFNGKDIQVDFDQNLESAVFVVIHLFGHSVQWNTSAELRRLGIVSATSSSDFTLAQIYDYEREATRYSLALLHEAGVTDLDRWTSDFWHADFEYLMHFYKTGERLDVPALLRPGRGELLTPLAIPPFSPQRYVSRFSF